MLYVPSTKLSEFEIRAGLTSGTLHAWRRDANNVLWFRSMPTMQGIPAPQEFVGDGCEITETEFDEFDEYEYDDDDLDEFDYDEGDDE